MANRWIDFVKAYAKDKNISYTCAMCEIKTKNPITEHKVDILDRLNPNMSIGRGMIKMNKYK